MTSADQPSVDVRPAEGGVHQPFRIPRAECAPRSTPYGGSVKLGAYAEVGRTGVAAGRKDPRRDGRRHARDRPGALRRRDRPLHRRGPQPSGLVRSTLGTLYDARPTAVEIHRVAAENPARVLGLE
jgi:hypothetical protein